MNHALHYAALIDRARTRCAPTGYTERHHVIPRCLGGTNAAANIVRLTGREHFVAHQLLAHMYPDRPGLRVAVVRMARQAIGARAYSWLRQSLARATSEMNTGRRHTLSARSKISAAQLGVPHSAETRERISKANTGYRHTAAAKERMSAAHKGSRHTAATKDKISVTQKARVFSEEHKQRISEAKRGVPKDAAHRAKISEGLRRFYGG